MKQAFGSKVKVPLPRSYHSADTSKSKFLIFKGVSINITINEFKELLVFNKITHAEAERMKSKRAGRYLLFIKIKCDDPKKAEAYISGGLICHKTDIVFKVEEFRIIDPAMFQVPRFRAQGTKERCVVCGEAHSHKNCPNKHDNPQNVQITEVVLRTRIKLLGNMWSKNKFLMPPL